MSWLSEAWSGVCLAARLPRLLRHLLGLPEGRTIVAARLVAREACFLEVLRRGIFDRPASPYRALLEHARCERVASLVWDQAGAVRVERRPPLAVTSGKIHHVYPVLPRTRS